NEDLEGVLIVHDDLDLEPGIVKIKKSGSAGGHNGIQSIIDRLGSRDFPRVKVGIGRPERMPVERYVLRPFAKKEKPVIEEAIETAADAVADIITKGVTYAQNKYH
ncbi:MAG TPA: peptidyl-tRNA hydrolase, partial [Nitrospirae bacterium]|nr:peptidyl-tRNA hydrolase [Nitrospirota bacterium]